MTKVKAHCGTMTMSMTTMKTNHHILTYST